MPKINKNVIIFSVAVVLIFGGILLWTLFQKIHPQKEITPIVPKEEETTNEVLERLTPAEPKPLTEEEKKEQEELLNQLTPTQPKPMTPQEKKEMEELLKQLTP